MIDSGAVPENSKTIKLPHIRFPMVSYYGHFYIEKIQNYFRHNLFIITFPTYLPTKTFFLRHIQK